MRSPRPSAAIFSRSTLRACARCRPISPPSACRRRWRGRPSLPPSSSAMRGRRVRKLAEIVQAGEGPKAEHRHPRLRSGASLGRALGALCAARDLRGDQGPPHVAHLRQHALASRDAVPCAVALQRRESAHRAASRLARCRAAAEGRGGDGGGQAPRRGVHLDARPRHRLGRRRSRHQCRRAERRKPACPAHRPRQSPARRAEQGSARAGEPLRGGGMPGGARGGRGGRAGHARRRGLARSTCSPSTCSAWPARGRSIPISFTAR